MRRENEGSYDASKNLIQLLHYVAQTKMKRKVGNKFRNPGNLSPHATMDQPLGGYFTMISVALEALLQERSSDLRVRAA